jgi:hypothetical protein
MHQPVFSGGVGVCDFDNNRVSVNLELANGHIRMDRCRKNKKQNYQGKAHRAAQRLEKEYVHRRLKAPLSRN